MYRRTTGALPHCGAIARPRSVEAATISTASAWPRHCDAEARRLLSEGVDRFQDMGPDCAGGSVTSRAWQRLTVHRQGSSQIESTWNLYASAGHIARMTTLDSTPSVGDSAPVPHQPNEGMSKLMLGAIGVVYGDIGTSPLYAMKESFLGPHP